MTTQYQDAANVAGIKLDDEIVRFADLVRSAALQEASELVDHIYKPGGGTYADAILELKGN